MHACVVQVKRFGAGNWDALLQAHPFSGRSKKSLAAKWRYVPSPAGVADRIRLEPRKMTFREMGLKKRARSKYIKAQDDRCENESILEESSRPSDTYNPPIRPNLLTLIEGGMLKVSNKLVD